MNTPKSDPLVKAARKANREAREKYRATYQYRLDLILKEESRWKRRVTIAENKLAGVRSVLADFTKEVVKHLDSKP